MTRQECEEKLLAMAIEMRKVYEQYNPDGDFLSVIADSDGYICVSDCFFADGKVVIGADESMMHTVDVVRYGDGRTRFGSRTEETVCA